MRRAAGSPLSPDDSSGFPGDQAETQAGPELQAHARGGAPRRSVKEYRSALRSFLDVLAKTGDPQEAMTPLLELDRAKLAADAGKYFDEKTKWVTTK